jgi:hypothetical protein
MCFGATENGSYIYIFFFFASGRFIFVGHVKWEINCVSAEY